MSTLIVYATRYGTTARYAAALRETLGAGAEVVRLRRLSGERRRDMETALDAASVVVIGGPIYAGRIRPEVSRFCERYRSKLLERRVALFICCLETGDRAKEELEAAYPVWLTAHAVSRRILGGEVRLRALRPLDRFLFTRFAGQLRDASRLDLSAVSALAAVIDAP
jgi:menaquinone-dependent protoporphyrinogen oxidase